MTNAVTIRPLNGTQAKDTRCCAPNVALHSDSRIATHVETVECDTGNQRGVSFFALCEECAALVGQQYQEEERREREYYDL